jgi:hypothetical protein
VDGAGEWWWRAAAVAVTVLVVVWVGGGGVRRWWWRRFWWWLWAAVVGPGQPADGPVALELLFFCFMKISFAESNIPLSARL